MPREISFDRKGQCPICRKEFRSSACQHSWHYVNEVVKAANNRRKGQNFNKDIDRLAKMK